MHISHNNLSQAHSDGQRLKHRRRWLEFKMLQCSPANACKLLSATRLVLLQAILSEPNPSIREVQMMFPMKIAFS
jgi:hypothetical protein